MTTEYGKFNPSADGTAYREMLIEYTGGIGIGVTNEKGPLAVYDRNGKCVLFKDDASYSKISFGGGVVTALKTTADGTARYVAYGLDGSEIVGFEQGFTALTKFVGGYAIGVAKNYSSSTDCLIVAADGKVYPSQTYASKSTYFTARARRFPKIRRANSGFCPWRKSRFCWLTTLPTTSF